MIRDLIFFFCCLHLPLAFAENKNFDFELPLTANSVLKAISINEEKNCLTLYSHTVEEYIHKVTPLANAVLLKSNRLRVIHQDDEDHSDVHSDIPAIKDLELKTMHVHYILKSKINEKLIRTLLKCSSNSISENLDDQVIDQCVAGYKF